MALPLSSGAVSDWSMPSCDAVSGYFATVYFRQAVPIFHVGFRTAGWCCCGDVNGWRSQCKMHAKMHASGLPTLRQPFAPLLRAARAAHMRGDSAASAVAAGDHAKSGSPVVLAGGGQLRVCVFNHLQCVFGHSTCTVTCGAP